MTPVLLDQLEAAQSALGNALDSADFGAIAEASRNFALLTEQIDTGKAGELGQAARTRLKRFNEANAGLAHRLRFLRDQAGMRLELVGHGTDGTYSAAARHR